MPRSVWTDDLKAPSSRLDVLDKADVQGLERPFFTYSFSTYKGLSQSTKVPLAGGEGLPQYIDGEKHDRLLWIGIHSN